MQVEVSTRARLTRAGLPEIVLKVLLTPRGSGNRGYAERLAKAFRQQEIMRPHIKRVHAGTSSVTVYLKPSVGCMRAINEVAKRAKAAVDVPGQMGLFGVVPA